MEQQRERAEYASKNKNEEWKWTTTSSTSGFWIYLFNVDGIKNGEVTRLALLKIEINKHRE